tara:strand:+ start:144 stop:563 length:420 start_codon:yes stop_codon:yes gene_type:complete
MMPDFKTLIERLKANEGFRSKVYKDHLGFDTIGYGFAIKNLELTEKEAEYLLANRVSQKHLHLLDNLNWYKDMPPEVQGVILEMVYQIGFSGFKKFKKAIANMKDKNWKSAADEMLDSRWAKQTPNRANQLADIVWEHG